MDHKNITTKSQVMLALILTLLLCITGATYAYLMVTGTNNNTITGNMATVSLSLDVEKIFPLSSVQNNGALVPQISVSGSATSPLANALKSGCVDANNNVVCQVYKITIGNSGSTATQVVEGRMFFYSHVGLTRDATLEIPNLRWRVVSSVDEVTPHNSVLGTNVDKVAGINGDNVIVSDLTMTNNSSYDYYIIVWLNETGTEQLVDVGKTFYGKVEFNSSNGGGVTAVFGNTS